MLDTSDELNISPYLNGVKITRPGAIGSNIRDIFKSEFNCYLLDTHCITHKMNDHGAISIGFDSARHAQGKTIASVSNKKTGQRLITNSFNVMRQQRITVIEETQLKRNGEQQHFLSMKVPLYIHNTVAGLFGCSIILGKHNLISSLQKIAGIIPLNQHAVFNHYISNNSPIPLSTREHQCLVLAIRGKTAKQTAIMLNLSYRTVEEYLNNVKRKLNVTSKSQMIDKGIHLLFSLF